MIPVSAVIITKDEAHNVDRCLRSLDWAAEIVVVDSGSRDATPEICQRHGCRFISSPWLGFGPTKQLAVDQASHDWVLSVDADEEIGRDLRDQIGAVLAGPPAHAGYRVRRRNSYLGYPIRYSGWQNDFPLRLFQRSRGGFDQAAIHEQVKVKGSIGTLTGVLHHHPYPTIDHHLSKIPRYARLGAQRRIAAGKSMRLWDLVLRGPFKFFKMYLLRQGFRDGIPGLILAGLSAYAVALKYYLIWEMSASRSDAPQTGDDSARC